MEEAIEIYYGEGKGKTAAAVGHAVHAASMGQRVVIIQFLKGKGSGEYRIISRLEPEISLFCFEKSDVCYAELSDKEQEEERANIRNTLNYAKKVLATGEYELVILDEVLGLVDEGVATGEEILQVLSVRRESTKVILTGCKLDEQLRAIADAVYKIDAE